MDADLTFEGVTLPIAEHLLGAPEDRYEAILACALDHWPAQQVFGLAMSILAWHLGQHGALRRAVMLRCGSCVTEERALHYAASLARPLYPDEAAFVLRPYLAALAPPPCSLDPFVVTVLNHAAKDDLNSFFVALPRARRVALLSKLYASRVDRYRPLCEDP